MKIFDNSTSEKTFKRVLKDVIAEDGVKRVDMCVGYFNLRGWNFIANEVDSLEGAYIDEEEGRKFRTARLLIGMYQAPEEIIRHQYGKTFFPDADYVQKCKRRLAEDFKRQLLIGKSTKQDEDTLRVLVRQLAEKKYPVVFTCGGKACQHRHAGSAVFVPDKEPVFPADAEWSDDVFTRIIVDIQTWVCQEVPQLLLAVGKVEGGLGNGAWFKNG